MTAIDTTRVKKCSECGEYKPLDMFHMQKRGKFGKTSRCKTCTSKYSRAWRADNAEVLRKQETDYRRANQDTILYKAREKQRIRRLVCIEHYSEGANFCACCGESYIQFLCLDHIDGGGREQRRQLGVRGTYFYQWLIDNGFPPGLRVLCHNCNTSLSAYGFCPHEAVALL